MRYRGLCVRSGLVLLVLLLGANSATASTIYTYEGLPFTTVNPPYSAGDRVSGTITVPLPLAPNLVDADLTESVLGFSFFDGVEERNAENSVVCALEVSTDAAGAIIDWDVQLRDFYPGPGNPQHVIDTNSTRDLVGEAVAGGFDCDFVAVLNTGEVFTPGAWSSTGTITPFVYSYEGAPFSLVTPPYTTSHSVTGSMTLTGPLPPYVPNTDMQPFLLDVSLTDGFDVLDLGNAALCAARVASNGSGNIGQWSVALRGLPLPPLGDPHRLIDAGNFGDLAGTGPAGPEICSMIIGITGGQSFAGGSWTSALPPGTPTTYDYIGSTFVNTTGAWLLGEKIRGSVTLDSRLEPNLPLTDVSVGVVDYEFRDGTQVRAVQNSTLCHMRLGTDSAGRINEWQVGLRQAPTPLPGDPQRFMDFTNNANDVAGAGPAAVSACAETLGLFGQAIGDGPGRWQIWGEPEVIPTLSRTMQIAMVITLLLGLALVRRFS